MGYYGFTYTMAPVRLFKDLKAEPYCFNTGCSASLINQQFLKA